MEDGGNGNKRQRKERGKRSRAHSQIWGQFFVQCARTKTEGDETVECEDAECMEGRFDGSQCNAWMITKPGKHE